MFTICWDSKYKRAAKNTPAITARVERKKKIEEFIIDETLIKIGSELIWLWVAIGLESKEILGIRISKERNILLAEQFISSLVKIHGQHPVIIVGRICRNNPSITRNLNVLPWLHAFRCIPLLVGLSILIYHSLPPSLVGYISFIPNLSTYHIEIKKYRKQKSFLPQSFAL
jgi:DDE domain